MNFMTQEAIRSSVNITVHERNVATCLCVTGELYHMVPTVSVVEEAPCLSDSWGQTTNVSSMQHTQKSL